MLGLLLPYGLSHKLSVDLLALGREHCRQVTWLLPDQHLLNSNLYIVIHLGNSTWRKCEQEEETSTTYFVNASLWSGVEWRSLALCG